MILSKTNPFEGNVWYRYLENNAMSLVTPDQVSVYVLLIPSNDMKFCDGLASVS